MSDALPVDPTALREEVKTKYRAVAVDPHGGYHFHTGRLLARHLGYDEAVVARMPESAIEAFAGVGNPFSQGMLRLGERVVDLGSGGDFDCFVAAEQVGPEGRVVGVDMTDEMLERSRAAATAMGLGNVEFRRGRSSTRSPGFNAPCENGLPTPANASMALSGIRAITAALS